MSEKDVSHPFMTMILTCVTMVRWADVPDSDRGDFIRRRAVDISSLYRADGHNLMTQADMLTDCLGNPVCVP